MPKRTIRVVCPTFPIFPALDQDRIEVWVPCQVGTDPADPSCFVVVISETPSHHQLQLVEPKFVKVEEEVPDPTLGTVPGKIRGTLLAWNPKTGDFLVEILTDSNFPAHQIWVIAAALPELKTEVGYLLKGRIDNFALIF